MYSLLVLFETNWKYARRYIYFLKHSILKYHMDSDALRRGFVESKEAGQKKVDSACLPVQQNALQSTVVFEKHCEMPSLLW